MVQVATTLLNLLTTPAEPATSLLATKDRPLLLHTNLALMAALVFLAQVSVEELLTALQDRQLPMERAETAETMLVLPEVLLMVLLLTPMELLQATTAPQALGSDTLQALPTKVKAALQLPPALHQVSLDQE